MKNSSNAATVPSLSSQGNTAGWIVVFSVVAVAIVITNSLTIASFRKLPARQRSRAHIFLINLAVADLLVGLSAIPTYIDIVSLRAMPVSSSSYEAFVIIDMFLGLASNFTLTIVALERLYAIFKPFRLRQIPTKTYLKSLPIPWIMSALVGMTYVLRRRGILPRIYFQIITVPFLFAPLSITCLAYILVWIKVKLQPFTSAATNRDRRLAFTLLITTVVFLVTWLPFSILGIVIVDHPRLSNSFLQTLPMEYVKLLQYCNSFMNPIIYCLRIAEFRKVMFSMMSCHKRSIDGEPGDQLIELQEMKQKPRSNSKLTRTTWE